MRNKSLAGRANNRAERPRKVAIYIRVSTTHQIDKDSLPMQRKVNLSSALRITKYLRMQGTPGKTPTGLRFKK